MEPCIICNKKYPSKEIADRVKGIYNICIRCYADRLKEIIEECLENE